jgi:hypothetical protein
MSVLTIAIAQVLLTCQAPGPQPLRFGFPLPAKALERGLRVSGPPGVALQWRRLQRRPDRVTGRVWVELCLVAPPTIGRSRVRILAGGRGPVDPAKGTVVRREVEIDMADGTREETVRRHWRTGVVDEVRHITFASSQEFDGETFSAGENLTLGLDAAWFTRSGITPSTWRRAGVLPKGGALGREYRRRLLRVVRRLPELRTLRDRGDYRRSKDVMTNLEFDTSLVFGRLGLAHGDLDLLARALRSAVHSADHDLDQRTSLLHRHGLGHQTGPPDPGHTWLRGILLAGCLAAEDRLIGAARRIARGLARHPAMGEGRDDLVREVGWPLAEMEAWLRFEDDREVAGAVASLIAGLRRRFDKRHRVFRFGEGERSKGVYEAPLWVTAGSLMPGLRAYVARTKDREIRDILRRMERGLANLIRVGKPGIPVRAWMAGGKVLRHARVSSSPSVFMLLEGLNPSDLRRCLSRRLVSSALGKVPAFDDPDLPTSFTIVGRCAWIYR